MTWSEKLDKSKTIPEIYSLPKYAFQFVFQNLSEFKTAFILLTIGRILSSLLKFYAVILLGQLISTISEYSITTLVKWYLPALLLVHAVKEVLDYFTRRYAEPLPAIYADYISRRFLATFYSLPSHHLFNVSKERLSLLVSKYVEHLRRFLGDWTWFITGHVTTFVIVLAVLGYQSPYVLAANLLYMITFLLLSFRLSKAFSSLAARSSETGLAANSFYQGSLLALNFLKRMRLEDYLYSKLRARYGDAWNALEETQQFHAFRWIVQLNIFNTLYIGTLCYGVYQVKMGTLPLGFLILIKWSFDSLWSILTFAIEYFVTLIQQREDVKIIQSELDPLFCTRNILDRTQSEIPIFQELTISNLKIKFQKGEGNDFSLSVPTVTIKDRAKIGIVGPSGSGKSSLFRVLLGVIPFEGEYTLNGSRIDHNAPILPKISYVSPSDPLLTISLRDNLLFGRECSDELLTTVLHGTCVSEFSPDLNAIVGSPSFNLSAGQEQRVRLARTLLHDGDILLLDEPFNGIDGTTKQKIIAFLKEFLANKTVLMATHLKEELSLVEKIYEIRDGILMAPTTL